MENQLWLLLLKLKQKLSSNKNEFSFCHLRWDGAIAINSCLESDHTPHIIIAFQDSYFVDTPDVTQIIPVNKFELKIVSKGLLDDTELQFLKTYLPYCLFPVYARQMNRAITTAHFAQTLDGRIATLSGHSKWIGNQENLIHAHRMRALSDAILIGTGTLTKDKPKLTVRLVPGDNPQRVVLGRPVATKDYACLAESCSKQIIAIGAIDSTLNGRIDYTKLDDTENGRIHSIKVLEHLYQRGIYSIYLEGGAITTSNFLIDKAIDVLQLHLSPLIFGSGKSAITLPEIAEVQNAVQFDAFRFQQVGDTIMFIGQLI